MPKLAGRSDFQVMNCMLVLFRLLFSIAKYYLKLLLILCTLLITKKTFVSIIQYEDLENAEYFSVLNSGRYTVLSTGYLP